MVFRVSLTQTLPGFVEVLKKTAHIPSGPPLEEAKQTLFSKNHVCLFLFVGYYSQAP